ncbi:MAG: response regulator transcription factor [Firmicutes bacterium]|nr:response regulator transcription factor [Bacillota bacterium]
MKILIVDDEAKMRNLIKIYLKREGFLVKEAKDGEEALDKFHLDDFSLILLDIMMPKIDGWTVCRKIRQTSEVPIIMFTARGEEYDKLFGFELGVDDYITKPFSPKEMLARVKAVLKRTYKTSNESIKVEDILLKPQSRQLFINNKEVYLTPKEYDLFLLLIKNINIVFTREQLLNKIWGYDFLGDSRTVDTHIKQLREKLKGYKNYIKTIWGTGYKFKVGD